MVEFESWHRGDPVSMGPGSLRALLVESGQWTAFRTRPFSVVPSPTSSPDAIFVTAIDSNPLAPLPEVVLQHLMEDFDLGLRLICQLTEGATYLCLSPGSAIAAAVSAPVSVEEFAGPHPAGTAGLHIHTLAPVSRNRTVWHIGYQDVAAIGILARTGALSVARTVSIAGPPVRRPRLLMTRLGASLTQLAAGEGLAGDLRIISGSVLSGKAAISEEFAYLGRYHCQISVVREENERQLLGWLTPGSRTFSVLPLFLSKLFPGRRFDFGTSTNGASRAIVPIGLYERVMPLDIQPTYLLRALMVGDTERAEQLGCLELDEEDLSLCTFVDPGKTDFGPVLRKNLELIMKEG